MRHSSSMSYLRLGEVTTNELITKINAKRQLSNIIKVSRVFLPTQIPEDKNAAKLLEITV